MSFDIKNIDFQKKDPELFSRIAEDAAYEIKNSRDVNANKQAQLRKFYDELVMWYDKINNGADDKKQERFSNNLIYIKMLKAKVAYAKGRKTVDDTFKDIFDRTIDQINSNDTLHLAKLFMEAVMGYCKFYDNKK